MKDIMPSARTNMSEINGVVIPLHPTWDKLTALWIICKTIGRQPKVISYSSTDPKDIVLTKYRNLGYYLLDVGENKYQDRKTGSAVETVCADFGITDPHLLALAAIANFNNRTGNLKEYTSISDNVGEEWQFNIPYGEDQDQVETVRVSSSYKINWAIPWLLREAYKVGIDTNLVIKRVHNMLDAWYQVSMENTDRARWEFVAENGSIGKIWKIFGNPKLMSRKGNFALPQFSLPWLVWARVVIGKDQMEFTFDQIEEEVAWWTSVQKAVFKMRAEAKRQAAIMTRPKKIAQKREAGQIFALNNAPEITVGYFSADEVVSRELWPQPADPDIYDQLLGAIFGPDKLEAPKFTCLVVRHPITKAVSIRARKDLRLDFSEVCVRLAGLDRQKRGEKKGENETQIWYLEEKGEGYQTRHSLLNGSDNWPLPVTEIGIPTILKFVKESTRRFK